MSMRRLTRLLASTPDEVLAFGVMNSLEVSDPSAVLLVADHTTEFPLTGSYDAIVLDGVLSEAERPLELLQGAVGSLAPGGRLGVVELTADPDFAREFPAARDFVAQMYRMRPAYAFVPIFDELGLGVDRAEVRPAETAELAERFRAIARTSLTPTSRRMASDLTVATETHLLMLAIWVCSTQPHRGAFATS